MRARCKSTICSPRAVRRFPAGASEDLCISHENVLVDFPRTTLQPQVAFLYPVPLNY